MYVNIGGVAMENGSMLEHIQEIEEGDSIQ